MQARRKKVLWVDDEIEFLRAHIMFLETRGYSVIPVFSGDDAIQLVRQKPHEFDIVLLDEQMPGKSGLATLEAIKSLAPDLPVVMVTKSEEERLMENAFGKKIDGYLTKPVNPSQILSVCKRLIDAKHFINSELRQRFVRDYSENRVNMAGGFDANQWGRFYENLVRWDIELEEVEDEGLRQTHAGQKSDSNAAFSAFVAENYTAWVKGHGAPPILSPQVIERYLAPLLGKDQKVFFVVLGCMRLDQYLAIEPLLRQLFDVQRYLYYSILPTSTTFARNALFAGAFVDEIASIHPKLFASIDSEKPEHNQFEAKLLKAKLDALGIDLAIPPHYVTVQHSEDMQELLKSLPKFASKPLVSIVVNFVNLLAHNRSKSPVLREIVPDESAFRTLTRSWFQHSTLFNLLRELSRRQCTVVLTSDHGSVFCTRGTELYGAKQMPKSMRYFFGHGITSDERHTVFLNDPSIFRLPLPEPDICCAIARENYYFIKPEKFENYRRQYQNTFQYGGISMEEMIVPLAVLTPKA